MKAYKPLVAASVFLLLLLSTACTEKSSLYSDIPTTIGSITAYSHSAANYHPVPDSLHLRFNNLLRLLRITVVTEGCGPVPKARLTVEKDRIVVQFDMENSCVHVAPEYFDVDLTVSPIHSDVFQLVVEEMDFEKDTVGSIRMQRRVDVRELPGI